MQGFALLVDKYDSLHAVTSTVRRELQSIENNLSISQESIAAKYEELNNVHFANVVIRKLRQFMYIKMQIESIVKAHTSSSDSLAVSDASSIISTIGIRQLSVISKLIFDAENCLIVSTTNSEAVVKTLLSIQVVSNSYATIQQYSTQLRSYGKITLIRSVKEKNQSVIAACLQVHFAHNIYLYLRIIYISYTYHIYIIYIYA